MRFTWKLVAIPLGCRLFQQWDTFLDAGEPPWRSMIIFLIQFNAPKTKQDYSIIDPTQLSQCTFSTLVAFNSTMLIGGCRYAAVSNLRGNQSNDRPFTNGIPSRSVLLVRNICKTTRELLWMFFTWRVRKEEANLNILVSFGNYLPNSQSRAYLF